jgi:transposase
LVLLSNEGLSPPQVGQRVRFSGRTVRRYLARYEAEGLPGLLSQSPPGRPFRVTSDYLQQLEGVVERMPRDLNLPFSNWTTANLAEYMAQQTGIRIRARQLENYLKKHDWRLRRPTHSSNHLQDPALVAEKKK